MRILKVLTLLIGISLLTVACGTGGGGGGGDDSNNNQNCSHIPVISNLQYSPQSVELNEGGGSITVNGTIDFLDVGGDVSSLIIRAWDSNGNLVRSVSSAILGNSGNTTGTINIQMPVDTTIEDDYLFEITITDSQGCISNILTGNFSVGTTPVISDLQYSPQSVDIDEGGGAVTVNGTIDFSDVGGDIESLKLQSWNSSNTLVHDSTSTLIGFNGITTGTIDFQLTFDTTLEDDYAFEITVIDSQGFISNILMGSFSVSDLSASATITFTPTSLTITDATAGTVWDQASFTIIVKNANGIPLSNVRLNISFPFAKSGTLQTGYYVELLDDGAVTESPMEVTTETNGTYVLNFRFQRGVVAYVSDILVTSGTVSATATFTVAAS